MKLLITSDWQASWNNQDKLEASIQHMLEVCQAKQIKTIVHCGDIKQQYSPIDVRVMNFIVSAIKDITRHRSIEFIALLGNHDRAGMHRTSESWFPTLATAGAVTYESPGIHQLGKYELHMLPYSSTEEAIASLKQLQWTASRAVLIFHHEVRSGRFNQVAKISSGLKLGHLRSYKLCFGGHIHMYQQLADNVYYVGSPFAQDWGEANQQKGFLVVDLESSEVEFIRSKISGMYDPTWPGFKAPKSWKGSQVRVHVTVDRHKVIDISKFIEQTRATASKKYSGAKISVLPEFTESSSGAFSVDSKLTDEELIRSYLTSQFPNKSGQRQIVSYLAFKLLEQGSLCRSVERIQLISAEAKNFLCFKSLKTDYTAKGLTLVTGRNKDWPNRNNGSGKTSWLQVPVVALTGKTLKGQAFDSWVRRQASSKATAYVKLTFKLSDGRRCELIRQRRPQALKLTINGKDYSIGQGTVKTQARLEQLTGITWDILTNAMYLDQSKVSKVLLGTDTERKEIFYQFLDLSRFQQAQDSIKRDLRSTNEASSAASDEFELADYKASECRQALKELPGGKWSVSQLLKRLGRAGTAYAAFEVRYKNLLALKKEVSEAVSKKPEVQNEIQRFQEELVRLREVQRKAVDARVSTRKLKKTCPICQQKVNSILLSNYTAELVSKAKDAVKRQKIVEEKLSMREGILHRMDESRYVLASKHEEIVEGLSKYKIKVSKYKQALRQAMQIRAIKRRHKRKLQVVLKDVERLAAYCKALRSQAYFYSFCLSLFSKEGLPAYLAAQLCPALNAAAKKYSRLVSDSEIQIRFSLSEGSNIELEVINAHGGESLRDQSQGESRIASIITSFALREIMNPSNVMILDEPGEGLDAQNAKVFAEGLIQASKRFGTTLVTTHNPYILGELSQERRIEVVKENSVSKASLVQV